MEELDVLPFARQFATALDTDDFTTAATLLDEDCEYDLNGIPLYGPGPICARYEKNMLEGREKLDELVWGESSVALMNDRQAVIHFKDCLKHQGIKHVYQCEQILTFNDDGRIVAIKHHELPGEREALEEFYKKVGL